MIENKSILPPNATKLLKDFESATSSRISLLSENQLRWINNPDLCPAHILPWIAWAVSVDIWNENWSDEQKRTVIKQSIQVHKQSGTLGALRRALSIFTYAKIDIKEWFEYGGVPFTFKVFISLLQSGHTFDDLNQIFKTIMVTKNLRSHLESFNTELEIKSLVPKIASAFGYLEITTIYPQDIKHE